MHLSQLKVELPVNDNRDRVALILDTCGLKIFPVPQSRWVMARFAITWIFLSLRPISPKKSSPPLNFSILLGIISWLEITFVMMCQTPFLRLPHRPKSSSATFEQETSPSFCFSSLQKNWIILHLNPQRWRWISFPRRVEVKTPNLAPLAIIFHNLLFYSFQNTL